MDRITLRLTRDEAFEIAWALGHEMERDEHLAAAYFSDAVRGGLRFSDSSLNLTPEQCREKMRENLASLERRHRLRGRLHRGAAR